VSIEGATGILINITGGPDLTLHEVNEASTLIQEAAHEDANIIFGSVIDANIGDEVRITVIATGFDRGDADRYDTTESTSRTRPSRPEQIALPYAESAADRTAPRGSSPGIAMPSRASQPGITASSPAIHTPSRGSQPGIAMPSRASQPGIAMPSRGSQPGIAMPSRGSQPGIAMPARASQPAMQAFSRAPTEPLQAPRTRTRAATEPQFAAALPDPAHELYQEPYDDICINDDLSAVDRALADLSEEEAFTATLKAPEQNAPRFAHGSGPNQSDPVYKDAVPPEAPAKSRSRRMSSEFPRVHPSLRNVLSSDEGDSELDVPTFIRRQSTHR
jgi:cell division protein FtsZ